MASKTKQYDLETQAYTTSGTAAAYTLTIPKLDALYDELVIEVEFHVNCIASATLDINGLGALPLLTSEGVAVTADDLISTGRYTLIYDSGSGGFIISEQVASQIEALIQSAERAVIAGTTYTAANMATLRSTSSLVYTKIKSVEITVAGTYTLTRRAIGCPGFNGYTRAYKNGVPIGPEYIVPWTPVTIISENYAVNVGDTLEIRAHGSAGNCCDISFAYLKYDLWRTNEHITGTNILN